MQARLGRLDAEARELVTTAAVIGRSFGLPLLERLLPRARLLATLSELQWLQLVVEERGGTAPEYRFRHGLVQEVAYGTLLEPERRERHLQVGEALVELHLESPSEVYGLLAHHFAEADEPKRAVEFLLKAANAARAAFAEDEAIEQYRRALGFMERIGDEPGVRDTLLRMALTHHLAFDYHAANLAFSEAFAGPLPRPRRLEPSESITWAQTAAWDRAVAPGHSDTMPAIEITGNLFRGLVAIGQDFNVMPDLAERFTVSDDGRSYRFTLRPDALWSDGAPVTADDFAFTYAQMTKDDVADASWLHGVSASVADERTLEIRLSEPRSYFLYCLALTAFFPWPRHLYERDGRDWHRATPLVGNGPFVLTARDDSRVVIEASPYWRGSRGNVGKVTIELEASGAVAGERWRGGRYDVLAHSLAGAALEDDQTVVQRWRGMSTWYLGFNAARAPLDDARVRRGLAHAVDRRRLAAPLRAVATETGGLLAPTMPGHSHRVSPGFDSARAHDLLVEAGFAGGRGLGEITLACLDLWEDATAEVAAQFADIGVRVRLLPVASDLDLETAITQQAHAFVWWWGADLPDPGGGVLNSILRSMPWLYRNEELEALLAGAMSLHDREERLRTYREFERIWIGEQAALAPLGYDDRELWRRPWVTGMWANAVVMSTFADAVIQRPSVTDPPT